MGLKLREKKATESGQHGLIGNEREDQACAGEGWRLLMSSVSR